MAWEKEGKKYVNKYGRVVCHIEKYRGYTWLLTCTKPNSVRGYIDVTKTLKSAKAKAPALAKRARVVRTVGPRERAVYFESY